MRQSYNWRNLLYVAHHFYEICCSEQENGSFSHRYSLRMTLLYGLLKIGGAVAVGEVISSGGDLFMYPTDCCLGCVCFDRVHVDAWWLLSSVMDDRAPLHEAFSHTQRKF